MIHATAGLLPADQQTEVLNITVMEAEKCDLFFSSSSRAHPSDCTSETLNPVPASVVYKIKSIRVNMGVGCMSITGGRNEKRGAEAVHWHSTGTPGLPWDRAPIIIIYSNMIPQLHFAAQPFPTEIAPWQWVPAFQSRN
jgi:hypothetical protein